MAGEHLEESRDEVHVLRDSLGRAVQVDPMKPKLKPPGTTRLKLKCDELLPNSAFKFNLRRYTWGGTRR